MHASWTRWYATIALSKYRHVGVASDRYMRRYERFASLFESSRASPATTPMSLASTAAIEASFQSQYLLPTGLTPCRYYRFQHADGAAIGGRNRMRVIAATSIGDLLAMPTSGVAYSRHVARTIFQEDNYFEPPTGKSSQNTRPQRRDDINNTLSSAWLSGVK